MMYRLRDLSITVFLCALALAARLYNFRHGEPPAFTEIIPIMDALLPVGQYLRTPLLDLCPPAYYLILKPLTLAGSALWLMRLPSLLIGALTPPLLFYMLREHAGRLACFLGAFFLALCPLHIFFSQQAQPPVFAALCVLMAFFFFLEMRRENRLGLWIAYDVALILIFLLHREAAFVGVAFLVLHLARTWWYRATASRMRWRQLPPLGVVLFHHFVVAIVCLPWLALMPTKSEWYEARPLWSDLFSVPIGPLLLGVAQQPTIWWIGAAALFYLVLLPPLIRLLIPQGGVVKGALLVTALIIVLPFLWSLTGRTRFSTVGVPTLAAPLICLLLGSLLAHSRPVVRLPGFVFCVAAMATGFYAQARHVDNPPYAEVARSIEQKAPHGSVVVTWPDFADRMSMYFLGPNYQVVQATEFFEKWGEVTSNQVIYFANYQFPWRGAYPYTILGALSQFAKPSILYRNRLNLAVAATNVDMASLRLWYDDPETFNILDQPTSRTLFMFYPSDKAFRGPEFVTENAPMEYESSGRRCIWLAREFATVPLKVALEPGRYVLRLHASPDFECPDTDERVHRSVNVIMRVGEEQVRSSLDHEGVIELPLEVDVELKTISLMLRVDKVDVVECPRRQAIALKIYSLAIDALTGDPAAN
jgi:hypothetical protein